MKWLDVDGVDAIVDVPNSAVGLTINSLVRDSKMTFLASSTASSDLTGKACSPNTIQWVNDAWATGNTTASAMMARGGKDWYFISVNYALGQGIEAEATNFIEKHGGKVLGSSKHPLGTSDFASFLLQAQNSKAKVIGLANAGGDTINAVKQAAEFGIQQSGQTMVAFLLFVNDVLGMGLKVAHGLQILESFYWDMDDDTRAFAKRFAARPGMNGKMAERPRRGFGTVFLGEACSAQTPSSRDMLENVWPAIRVRLPKGTVAQRSAPPASQKWRSPRSGSSCAVIQVSRANQMSPPSALLNSLRELNGTTQRLAAPSHRTQCSLPTFRMFVVPPSGFIRSNSLKSTGLPLASSLAARFLVARISANCDDCIPHRAMASSRPIRSVVTPASRREPPRGAHQLQLCKSTPISVG